MHEVAMTEDTSVARADRTLYIAKNAGRKPSQDQQD